ncbi:MAG: Mur ligase family protein [Steroidobacteraceae bacterium]
MLEAAGISVDEVLIEGWRARVLRARAQLGWTAPGVVARRHARGVSFALAAPCDRLMAATEVNEWALCAALVAHDPDRWSGLGAALAADALEDTADPQVFDAPVLDETAALARFGRLAHRQARPDLTALLAAAATRELPHVLDDDTLTLGAGARGRDFSLAALPRVAGAPWNELGDIPTALVTGSNGKTTTVRLLAACARAHGWPAAYCCTDGVFLDRELLAAGDYAGPAGARRVMRERGALAAVVETARGGILRRGLALSHAHVAVVTNVSPDHFGEYGIDDLEALADAKLTVAGVVIPGGLLVLNADDARLVAKAPQLAGRFGRSPPLGWFALDDAALLREHRARGGSTCGARHGRLILSHAGAGHDLGAIAAMPLTIEGSAHYNIANLAGSALAAVALGIAPATIAAVFARFGQSAADNVGRMMRFDVGGVRVLVDYAHNPQGLRGLLEVALHLKGGTGRLGVLLGHAGNRQDSELEALAHVAAEFHPDLIVVKENEAHLRGREPGEVPRLIRAALLHAGLPESALPVRMSELEAARCALEWARPGDVLALPVHSAAARTAVLALLSARR